jgi:predicted permease
MPTFLRRLRARIKYWNHDRDLMKEIDEHRKMAERAERTGGLPNDDARFAAARALGNTTLSREAARAVWLAPWIESLWQDVRYALRVLRRNPVFAGTAIAALAFGVSLNVSLFTVFDAAVLRPWLVPQSQRVVLAQPVRTDRGISGVSPVEGGYLRANMKSADLVMFTERRLQIGSDDELRGSPARAISANYFSALRLQLQMGAGFEAADDEPGRARPVFVMGAATWRRRFGADPQIVGKTVTINNVPFTVIGVAREDARDSALSPPPQAWISIASLPLADPNDEFSRNLPTNPKYCCVKLAARLRDGITAEAAAAEIAGLDRQYQEAQGTAVDGRIRLTSTRMADQPQAARFLPAFAMMFAGTTLLLLLTCANVGNLLLARSMARQREIGVRLALGAGRGRVIRQLLTEGLVLIGASAALALPVARTLPALVLRWVADDPTEEVLDLALNPTVLLFTAALAVVSCLLFSLAPALRSTRSAAATVRASRGGSGAANRLPLRTALLAVQVAISAVLLVSAGLLSRGLLRAATSSLGFVPSGVASISIALPRNAYSEAAQNALGDELARQISAAGIGTYAIASDSPLSGVVTSTRLDLPGHVNEPAVRIEVHMVTPGYFDVLGVRLVSGRVFRDGERNVAVINRAFEERLAPGGSAIGLPIEAGERPPTVIGVVDDAKLTGLGNPEPAMFQAATGFNGTILAAYSQQTVGRVQAIVTHLDPRATVTVTMLRDEIANQLRASGIGVALAGVLGGAAVLLVAIGIFGVFSFMVTERSHEIGVRLALGAAHGDIVRNVLGGASIAMGGGLAIGFALSFAAGSILRSNLYGLSPRDPWAFAIAIAVLATAGAISTLAPLRRAMRVDPAITLRQD